MSRVALLQERLASAERERAALIDQRARIVEIFEETGQITASGDVPLSPEQQRLQQLERELETALLIFSEENPQVRLLQRQIDQLRGQVEADDAAAGEDESDGSPSSAETVLAVQLVQLDSQISTLDTIIETARTEIARLEDAINRTPLNAITLRSLERDFENVRQQYDNVIARLAEASTGERIEVTARGQRISIIENANVPREPSSPNRPLIVAMGVAAGLGLAGALFMLLELLNRSVRRPVDIQSAFGITLLATIPLFESPRRRIIRNTVRIVSVVVVLGGVPAGLWAVDTYFMPLDRLANRLLEMIGMA